MVSTDGSDLKGEDGKQETSEPIDAHYDPAFVRKTLYVFLRPPYSNGVDHPTAA